MEFKEFCRQRDRMCGNMPECSLNKRVGCTRCNIYCFENPDEAERIVSEWAKEHPIVRNIDKFLEVFGDKITQLYKNNVVNDEVDTAIKKWLFKEYKPPRKENADD